MGVHVLRPMPAQQVERSLLTLLIRHVHPEQQTAGVELGLELIGVAVVDQRASALPIARPAPPASRRPITAPPRCRPRSPQGACGSDGADIGEAADGRAFSVAPSPSVSIIAARGRGRIVLQRDGARRRAAQFVAHHGSGGEQAEFGPFEAVLHQVVGPANRRLSRRSR